MKKISRRDFLKATGITAAALGLTACGGSSSSTAAGSTAGNAGPKKVSYWMDLQQGGCDRVQNFNEMYCWQEITKNTGIEIEWNHPASGQAGEQFNLITSGKTLPDLMYHNWATAYPGGAEAAILDGKIVALNDYMDKLPNFSRYMELHPEMLIDVTTDAGNIYGFPAAYTHTSADSDVWQNCFEREPFDESFIGLIIRTDLLEKVNMPIPVTHDDWYNVLKAFKDQLGIEYPLCIMSMFEGIAQVFNAGFDAPMPTPGYTPATAWGIDKDGKVEYGPVKDGFREYVTFMHKLYSEKLLDNDYMVIDRTTQQSKVINGQVGAWVDMMPSGLGGVRTQNRLLDPNSTFEACGVHSPVRTPGVENWYHSGNRAFTGSATCITTSCKDIDAALALSDYIWGEEGNTIINCGIDGISYEMKDGWPAIPQKMIDEALAANTNPADLQEMYRQLNGAYQQDHWQRLVSKIDYTLPEGTVDQNIEALNTWSYGNGTQLVGLPATDLLEEEQSKYANTFNEIGTYVGQCMSQFITGAMDLAKWDEYVKTVWEMGLQDCIDIQQAALARYYARGKA